MPRPEWRAAPWVIDATSGPPLPSNRCSLAAGDPISALEWVRIALAVSRDNHQMGNEGRLMYLRGRCYQVRPRPRCSHPLDEHHRQGIGWVDTLLFESRLDGSIQATPGLSVCLVLLSYDVP